MTGTGVTQLPDTQVNFSPFKSQIRINTCPANPRINPCPVESFLENARSILFSTLIENTGFS